VYARAVSGCRSTGVTHRVEKQQTVSKLERWRRRLCISSSRRATPMSANWGHPGRKSPSVQSSTCACLSPLPPAVSMVISSAANHKIFVNGNTPVAAVRHRFRHICQRLRPRSHSQAKRGIADSPFAGYAKVCYRAVSCRSSDGRHHSSDNYCTTGFGHNATFPVLRGRS
jgi:hypothetical protein